MEKMKILIVDDDPIVRVFLRELLEENGYDTVVCENGADALARMEGPDAPLIVILDWMMPEMEGLEVIRKLRSGPFDPRPHILMLTSVSNKSDIITVLNAGADDYLVKPFDPGELRARVAVGKRIVTAEQKLRRKVEALDRALSEIKTLKGIIPICASCKKIRDDSGYWNQIESYIKDHSDAEFSHGVCPDCAKKLYPEFYKE